MLHKATLVGKILCEGKNDYKSGGISSGPFIAPKLKYVLTKDEFGNFQQHLTCNGFNDSKRLLDRSHFSDMLEGKNVLAMLPKSLKKSFNNGIFIPVKMRGCDKCRGKILCVTCNNKNIENEEFEANLYFLKREVPNEFGYMLLILQKTMVYL